MAIKYLDSRRIEGLSTEVDPTVTADYTDNYSSNSNWTQIGTGIDVNNSVSGKVGGAVDRSVNRRVYRDLGSALSDTKWLVRFEYQLVSNSGNGSEILFQVGDSTGAYMPNTGVYSAVGDVIGLRQDGNAIHVLYQDNASQAGGSNSISISTATTYYITVVRDGSNITYTIKTGSHNGTTVDSKVQSMGSNPSSLRYLGHGNRYDGQSGSDSWWVDNIEIYDGITSITTGYKPSLTPAVYGGWVEVGRTTLGSAGDTIDVTSLADKRYYMILSHEIASGTIYPQLHLNGDMDVSALNYSSRRSANGGSDLVLTDRYGIFEGGGASSTTNFSVSYLANYTSKEKLGIRHTVFQGTSGAGNAPAREEIVGKHEQTSNPISSVKEYNAGGGDYDTGSEVVVLGWDPSDTHTTNFWEELADVNASASSTSINTGTFTAKKYLWIQAYVNATGADITGINATVNSDTDTNYAIRVSNNGGADGTILSNDGLVLFVGGNLPQNQGGFVNMFVINNSANEKLFTGVGMKSNTVGAGNAPDRREFAQKWVTTGSQITSFQINRVTGTGTFDTTSFIKVWGSD